MFCFSKLRYRKIPPPPPPTYLGCLLVESYLAPNLWGGSGKPMKTQVILSTDLARTRPLQTLPVLHSVVGVRTIEVQ